METRIAVIAIIVEDRAKSEELNRILHEYGEYIVGRMAVPYRERGSVCDQCDPGCASGKDQRPFSKSGMLKGDPKRFILK